MSGASREAGAQTAVGPHPHRHHREDRPGPRGAARADRPRRLLPSATVAEHDEVLGLVERRRLAGRGIGWVGAHLLASALLDRLRLWTLDTRLAAVAELSGVAYRAR